MSARPLSSPAPAVEVVATLGDSVIGVRHLHPVAATPRPRTSRVLLAAGAALLATSAAAAGASARRAAIDADRREAWAAAGNPAWAFRADLGSSVLDAMGGLGLGLGLGAVVAGLARRRREQGPDRVTVGSGAGVDFAAAGLPTRALVAPAADRTGYVVDLTGIGGELTQPGADGLAVTIDAAAPPLQLAPGTVVRTRIGALGLLLRTVEAPHDLPPAPLAFDRATLAFGGGTAAVVLALLGIAGGLAPDAESASGDLDDEQLVFVGMAATAKDDAPPPPPSEASDDAGASVAGEASLKLDEGVTGADTDDHPTNPAKRQIAQRSDVEQRARAEAIEQAATAGILGTTMIHTAFAAYGSDAISSGFDVMDAIGAYDGTGVGAPRGFGDGVLGKGPGAGGDFGTSRTGGYITDGLRKRGDRWQGGTGTPCTSRQCGDRPVIAPTPGPPVVDVEGVDATIIRRYVQRSIQKIGYCYEKALLASPALAGTVKTQFTISPQGTVIGASASGVAPEVSGCVADVIKGIQFPKIGAVASIKYPFTFRRSGS